MWLNIATCKLFRRWLVWEIKYMRKYENFPRGLVCFNLQELLFFPKPHGHYKASNLYLVSHLSCSNTAHATCKRKVSGIWAAGCMCCFLWPICNIRLWCVIFSVLNTRANWKLDNGKQWCSLWLQRVYNGAAQMTAGKLQKSVLTISSSGEAEWAHMRSFRQFPKPCRLFDTGQSSS